MLRLPQPTSPQDLSEPFLYLPSELACQVQEGLLIIVVALGADFIVLQVFLPVESDLLGLYLPVLHVHLVAAQHNGDVFTHPAAVAERITKTSVNHLLGADGPSATCAVTALISGYLSA